MMSGLYKKNYPDKGKFFKILNYLIVICFFG